MKRIIALLLAIMMLPIFTVVSQAAATMSPQEFKEVLLGVFTDSTPDVNYKADLVRAYRNISKDQLEVMADYYDNVQPSIVGPMALPLPSSVVNDDETRILTYGFIKLMTFPKIKANLFDGTRVVTSENDIYFDNTVFDGTTASMNDDIDRAVAAFYTPVTIGSTVDTPANILNKVSGGTMTKNALGAFVIDLQKYLRAQVGSNTTSLMAFLSAFETPVAADYVNAIIPYVKTAAAQALTNPAGADLGVAKAAMIANHMLMADLSGNVSEESAFINLIVHTINTLKLDANVAAVVMNTIMSGVMDAVVEVYSDVAGTQPVGTGKVQPNKQVASLTVGDTVYLKVVSDVLAKLSERGDEAPLPFDPSLSPRLDAALTDTSDNLLNYVSVEFNPSTGNMLKVTGVSVGSGILKLYRDTDSGSDTFDFNHQDKHKFATHKAKELFMELDINVVPRSSTGGGGAISRVEAPIITFEVDGDKNITVTLETATKGATIYYTTDGTTPTKKSQKYEGPFQVEDGTTIKAFAVKGGYIDSYVTTDKIDLQEGLTPTLTGEHIAYVHGRDTGNFDADDNVTRGEVSAMFSRLLVKKMVFKDDSVSQFTDVVEGAWHTPYIKYLSNVKIINGYEDGTFKPDAPITRAEFATIASRFFELEKGAENTFADVTDSHWAKEYIDSAVIKGWLKGYEDGTFKPDQAIKRSEAVTIVNRMLNRAADKAYIEANYEKVLDYPDIDESHWAYYEILEASNWHDHKVENNQESWTDIFYQERFNAS